MPREYFDEEMYAAYEELVDRLEIPVKRIKQKHNLDFSDLKFLLHNVINYLSNINLAALEPEFAGDNLYFDILEELHHKTKDILMKVMEKHNLSPEVVILLTDEMFNQMIENDENNKKTTRKVA